MGFAAAVRYYCLVFSVLRFQFLALCLCLTSRHQPQVQLRNRHPGRKGPEGWANRRHKLRNSFLKELDVISDSFQPILQAVGISKVLKDLLKNSERVSHLIGSA